jgi:hypothetical protein
MTSCGKVQQCKLRETATELRRRMPRCASGEGAGGVRLAAAGHRVVVRLIRHTACREV